MVLACPGLDKGVEMDLKKTSTGFNAIAKKNAVVCFYLLLIFIVLMCVDPEIQPFVYVRF